MGRIVVGVMGPGRGAREGDAAAAFELGRLVAREGWVLLTGGRAEGVMDAASRGAKAEGGLTVGVLPGADAEGASDYVDIPVVTGMGQARNQINVLSSRAVVACGTGAGTSSEIALALKADKPVVLLGATRESEAFFKSIGGGLVHVAADPRAAIEIIKQLLADQEK